MGALAAGDLEPLFARLSVRFSFLVPFLFLSFPFPFPFPFLFVFFSLVLILLFIPVDRSPPQAPSLTLPRLPPRSPLVATCDTSSIASELGAASSVDFPLPSFAFLAASLAASLPASLAAASPLSHLTML
jgi:hypothetical protein